MANAQLANSAFSCSCTKDANGPFCAACRAAGRNDCSCNGADRPESPGPPLARQCAAQTSIADATKAAAALETIKADVKGIQQAQAAYDEKFKKTSAALRDFEASKKDCKITLSELMSDGEMDQAKQNHDKLQEMSACILSGLRKDIEALKRSNPTSTRIANQLTEVNGLIKDIEPLRFAMVDAQTRSTSIKADVRSVITQCK